MSLVKNEPVGTAAGILGIVTAAFPLLAAFKVNIDQAQQSAITGFLIVLLGFWVRSRVSPVGRAAKLREEDNEEDDDDPPVPPVSRPPLMPAACIPMACLAFALLIACGPDARRTKCPDTDLAKIEAAYLAEAVEACGDAGYDSCPALPELRAKYAARRSAWQECSK